MNITLSMVDLVHCGLRAVSVETVDCLVVAIRYIFTITHC
jgi:hypothetical protein